MAINGRRETAGKPLGARETRNNNETLGSEVFWDMGCVCPVVWVKKS